MTATDADIWNVRDNLESRLRLTVRKGTDSLRVVHRRRPRHGPICILSITCVEVRFQHRLIRLLLPMRIQD